VSIEYKVIITHRPVIGSFYLYLYAKLPPKYPKTCAKALISTKKHERFSFSGKGGVF
jgi:hypothetical protein